jgi:peptidoglycan-associated lipoprotein
MFMRAVILAFAAASLVGCATTPTDEQPPAGVEERAPGTAAAAKPAPDAQAVDRKPIPGVDLTAARQPGMDVASPLKDPSNILSKRSIYYDLDKFDIKDEFRSLVEAHAKYLRENPNARMLIQGNTDERGSREYNIGLGQRRADGVRRMLMLLGAKEDQIESVSLGEEKPKALGSHEEAWAQNRRSDMLYQGEY